MSIIAELRSLSSRQFCCTLTTRPLAPPLIYVIMKNSEIDVFIDECPKVGTALKSLEFSMDIDSEMTGRILTDGLGCPPAERGVRASRSPDAIASGRHHDRRRLRR